MAHVWLCMLSWLVGLVFCRCLLSHHRTPINKRNQKTFLPGRTWSKTLASEREEERPAMAFEELNYESFEDETEDSDDSDYCPSDPTYSPYEVHFDICLYCLLLGCACDFVPVYVLFICIFYFTFVGLLFPLQEKKQRKGKERRRRRRGMPQN